MTSDLPSGKLIRVAYEDIPLLKHHFTLLFICSAALASCGVMPNEGPYSGDYGRVANEHIGTAVSGRVKNEKNNLKFVFAELDARTVELLRQRGIIQFDGRFTARGGGADIRIGVGDIVRVTLFEAGAGGLFVPTGVTLSQGNFVTVPDQEVDRTGTIKVPYAGEIRVYNRRPLEVQREIEQRLANRAIEPQAVVTIVSRTSNLYTVRGDVNKPGRFNMTQLGDRVLDAIGNAGGAQFQDYETLVTIQRRGHEEATVRLSTIVAHPKNNIYLLPGDVVSLEKEERFYTLFGASVENGRYAFASETISIADALGRAGGLLDVRADPHSVVLYRHEHRDILEKMGAKLTDWPPSQHRIPTVYRVNLRNSPGYLLAQKTLLQDGDVLYISNAPVISLLKLNAIIRDISATINAVDGNYDNIFVN